MALSRTFYWLPLLVNYCVLLTTILADDNDCGSNRRYYDTANDTCFCVIPKVENEELKQYVHYLKKEACADDFWTWWLFTSWPFFVVGTILFIFGIQLWAKKKTRRTRDVAAIPTHYPQPPKYSVFYTDVTADQNYTHPKKTSTVLENAIPPPDKRQTFIQNFNKDRQQLQVF